MNKKIIISIFILATLTTSTFVVSSILKKSGQKITTNVSAILPRITADDLINKSDAVVLGKVIDLKILKVKSTVRPGEEDIVTNATISIERYISNQKGLSNKDVVVQTIGGTIGNETMISEESPTFQKGDRVIVALKSENSDVFYVAGWALGKYQVDDNNNIGNEKEATYFKNIFGKNMNVDEFENEAKNIFKQK